MSSRVIRDGLRTSEAIDALHDATFRLYVHLVLTADDYGLFPLAYAAVRDAAPLRTWDRETIAKMLVELVDAGLVNPYEVGGKRYGAIVRWQSVIRSKKPKYPIPTWGLTHVLMPTGFKDPETKAAAMTLLSHLEPRPSNRGTPGVYPGDTTVTPLGDTSDNPGGALGQEGLRGKGKGVKGKDGATRGSRLPQGWALPDDWEDWALDEAQAKGKPVQPSQVSEWALQFRDYWHSVPGAKGIKLDWQATWRNAVRDWYLPKVPAPAHAGNGTANPFRGGI